MSTAAWPVAVQEIVTAVTPAGSGFGVAVKVTVCASIGAANASVKRNTQLVIFFT